MDHRHSDSLRACHTRAVFTGMNGATMSKGLIRSGWLLLFELLFYSMISFLILHVIVLRTANQQLAHYATVPATLERLAFNTFTMTLYLHYMRLGEAKGQQAAF